MTQFQMENKMFITKQVLDQQVAIMKDERIPKMLKQRDVYVYRHLGNSTTSTAAMLSELGTETIDELMDQVVPESIRLSED